MASTLPALPVVNYHGSITGSHGLWCVTNTGERLELRSLNGQVLRHVRPASVTPVTMPRLTAKRADALMALWNGPRGRVDDTRTRNWLIDQELIVADSQRPGCFGLTGRGAAVARSVLRWYR